jgi:hypothetical protein
MSLFDKVKETALKGVDKAKETASGVQDTLEERKLEKQVSDLKAELGGLVYGQKTGAPADNADTEIARIVGEITATEAELAKATADKATADKVSADDAPGAPDVATG